MRSKAQATQLPRAYRLCLDRECHAFHGFHGLDWPLNLTSSQTIRPYLINAYTSYTLYGPQGPPALTSTTLNWKSEVVLSRIARRIQSKRANPHPASKYHKKMQKVLRHVNRIWHSLTKNKLCPPTLCKRDATPRCERLEARQALHTGGLAGKAAPTCCGVFSGMGRTCGAGRRTVEQM